LWFRDLVPTDASVHTRNTKTMTKIYCTIVVSYFFRCSVGLLLLMYNKILCFYIFRRRAKFMQFLYNIIMSAVALYRRKRSYTNADDLQVTFLPTNRFLFSTYRVFRWFTNYEITAFTIHLDMTWQSALRYVYIWSPRLHLYEILLLKVIFNCSIYTFGN